MKHFTLTAVSLLLIGFAASAYGQSVWDGVVSAAVLAGLSGGLLAIVVYGISFIMGLFRDSENKASMPESKKEKERKDSTSVYTSQEFIPDNTPLSKQKAEPPVTNSEPVSVTQEPIVKKPVVQVEASQEHFAEALKEIENNEKKDGLWAMAYANTPSEEEAKKHYINLRAEELLQAEELAKAEAVKLAKEERKRKANEADRLAKEEHKRKADEAQRRLKQHRIEVAKIPDLISWATRHSYIVESKSGSYRIRKEPFGKFESFHSDMEFLNHLTKLKEGSD